MEVRLLPGTEQTNPTFAPDQTAIVKGGSYRPSPQVCPRLVATSSARDSTDRQHR